jgi:hypothetical protein
MSSTVAVSGNSGRDWSLLGMETIGGANRLPATDGASRAGLKLGLDLQFDLYSRFSFLQTSVYPLTERMESKLALVPWRT